MPLRPHDPDNSSLDSISLFATVATLEWSITGVLKTFSSLPESPTRTPMLFHQTLLTENIHPLLQNKLTFEHATALDLSRLNRCAVELESIEDCETGLAQEISLQARLDRLQELLPQSWVSALLLRYMTSSLCITFSPVKPFYILLYSSGTYSGRIMALSL